MIVRTLIAAALLVVGIAGCSGWGILTMRGASPIAYTGGGRAWFGAPLSGSYETQEQCQAALVTKLDDEMRSYDSKVYAATRVNPNTIKWRGLATGEEVYASHQCMQR